MYLVSDNQDDMLVVALSFDEVKDIVFNINLDSAPGPDAITTHFFQHCRYFISIDLYLVAVAFFKGEHIPSDMVKKFICMIPKKSGPQRLKEFRPISLCNVEISYLF